MAGKGARVHIYGDWDGTGVKKAQQDLSMFGKQSAQFSGAFTKSMLGAGAALGGAFAVTSLMSSTVDFLKDSAAAAIEDEKSVVALSKAMDNLGLSAQTNGMEQFARDTMLATGTADDLIRNGLQKLVTATGDAKQAQDLLSLSMDISAATGKELSAVTQAMARASTGQVSALTRLGIPLDANIIKTKDFAAATEVLSSKFEGQAAAAADTYGGRMKIMSAAVDEAKETIGYALLGALSDATEALGGEGGMSDAITVAGELAAGLVTGLGGMVTGLIELTQATKDANSEDEGMGGLIQGMLNAGHVAQQMMGPFGVPIRILEQLTLNGLETTSALKAATEGFNGFYGSAAQGEQTLARAEINLRGIATGADDATTSVDELKDAVKEFQDAISLSQSLDDFREDLRNIGDDLKDSATTIFGPAGKDVRDKAREIFGQIPTIVQQMVDQGEIAAGDFDSTVDSMSRKAVRTFAKNGIDAKDLEDWLGGEGIWTDPVKDRMRQVAIDAAAAATKAGKDLGVALAQGIPVGLLSQSRSVQAAGMRLIAQAEQAMKDAAIIKSPSKLFAEIGKDIALGVAVGIADTATAAGEASRDLIDSAFGDAQGALDDALEAVADFKQDYVDTILGGVDIGAAFEAMFDKDGKATGRSFTDGLLLEFEQGSWANNVFTALKAAGASQELLDMLYAKGADAGAVYGQAILDEGSAVIVSDALGQLTTASGDAANSMVPSFMTAGVAGAQAMVDEFVKAFGPGGAGRTALVSLMGDLAGSMNVTAYIDVVTRSAVGNIADVAGGIVAGARANGGPVTRGSTYLVGEKGPELFTASASGTIIPNGGSMRSGGGNTYVIHQHIPPNVDLAAVGRASVEAIRAYERSSGKVYASA